MNLFNFHNENEEKPGKCKQFPIRWQSLLNGFTRSRLSHR